MTVPEAKKILEKHGERIPPDDQIAREIEFIQNLISMMDIRKLLTEKGKCYEKEIIEKN